MLDSISWIGDQAGGPWAIVPSLLLLWYALPTVFVFSTLIYGRGQTPRRAGEVAVACFFIYAPAISIYYGLKYIEFGAVPSRVVGFWVAASIICLVYFLVVVGCVPKDLDKRIKVAPGMIPASLAMSKWVFFVLAPYLREGGELRIFHFVLLSVFYFCVAGILMEWARLTLCPGDRMPRPSTFSVFLTLTVMNVAAMASLRSVYIAVLS